jgi:hypothetical protein
VIENTGVGRIGGGTPSSTLPEFLGRKGIKPG